MAHALHDLLQVLLLVVRWQYHENVHGRRRPRRYAHALNLILTTCLNMSKELLIGLTLVGAELRQTTGTSAMRTPRFFARNSTSGSKPKPSVVRAPKASFATSARKSLKPHCVSQMPGSR